MNESKKVRRKVEAPCEHVYNIMGTPICLLCSRSTHEIDWTQQLMYRKAHVEKYGIMYQAPVSWWSI